MHGMGWVCTTDKTEERKCELNLPVKYPVKILKNRSLQKV